MNDETEQHAWRAKVGFRQAEGLVPLPQPLKWGELDRELRLEIHDVFSMMFRMRTVRGLRDVEYTGDFASLLVSYYRDVLHWTRDNARHYVITKEVREHILRFIENGDWAEVLELLTFSIRSTFIGEDYRDVLIEALSGPRSPYRIFKYQDGYAIIPQSTEAERAAISGNLESIFQSTFEGAKEHFGKAIGALDALGAPKHADVVREFVHAVQSAVRVISGKPKATLSDALKLIKGQVPTALYDGMQKLYGYASDEKGVRHSLVEGENERLGQDEAIFAFSVCAAIVGFLVRKFPEKS